MSKKILILSNSFFNSGAEYSLHTFIQHSSERNSYIYAGPQSTRNASFSNNKVVVYQVPFIWLVYTLNPFRIFYAFINLIICTVKLCKISKTQKVDLIYVNSVKAILYGVCLKLFTRNKLIWHIRDNLGKSFLWKICVHASNKLIKVSDSVKIEQSIPLAKVQRIYTGVDVTYWLPISRNRMENIQIAQIGQLTRWKNHTDFIRMAYILSQKHNNVNFILVGDDLSGREKRYKKELTDLVNQLGLSTKLFFLGNRADIKNVINNIDILVHPTFNEPFGRVLVEAMALEKPVVAYKSGGPQEIIEDNITGYLTEPGNIEELAEKTSHLINHNELRVQFGKAGRQRVIKEYNVERFVREMEEAFDCI